jgi:hypothetical protein
MNKNSKSFKVVQGKPIDKHGNYQGTDVGITSKSIENPPTKKVLLQSNSAKTPKEQLEDLKELFAQGLIPETVYASRCNSLLTKLGIDT